MPVVKDERAQIWIIGTRDQVVYLINECYVRKLATDRANFTPIIPAPFAAGKYMTVLVR
ncbi:MAG: hypothetical protein Kow00121_50500 [Elainellaceae cyanobacterium]